MRGPRFNHTFGVTAARDWRTCERATRSLRIFGLVVALALFLAGCPEDEPQQQDTSETWDTTTESDSTPDWHDEADGPGDDDMGEEVDISETEDNDELDVTPEMDQQEETDMVETDMVETDMDSQPELVDPCDDNPCSAPHRTMCTSNGEHFTCACDAGYQDNDDDGTCIASCATAGLDCLGHGVCSDFSGAPLCSCDEAWSGYNCEQCASGYEMIGVDCVRVAEYVIKDMSVGGRYIYRPHSPWPEHIKNDVWTADQVFPFAGIDSMVRLETTEETPWELFTFGNQYILLENDAWVSCITSDCQQTRSGPGQLCDAYWGEQFPFCEGIDAMTQLGRLGETPLFIATRGTQYVLWNPESNYHHWDHSVVPGVGTIGDDWWQANQGDFPFSTIDAMVDYHDGEDRILFVQGRQFVTCRVENMLCRDCSAAVEIGSANDTFFPYRWQNLPFAKVPGEDSPVDAIIRSGGGDRLFIVSNTALPRLSTTGKLRIRESDAGPPQRSLVMSGSPYEQGFAHGYLLGEEILAVLNDIVVPMYEGWLVQPLTSANGATGYQAARVLSQTYDFGGEYAVYLEELEGIVAGIEANPATTGLVGDGQHSWPVDVTDLLVMQLVDDIWGMGCKSATIYPDDDPTVDRAYHLSIIDWDTQLGRYSLIQAYDNSASEDRMSWVLSGWSGNVSGWTFGINEAAIAYSYVSAGSELRSCPARDNSCVDLRFGAVEGLTVHSTAFATRRIIERAADLDEAYTMLGGETTMTVSMFTGTLPRNGVGTTPAAVFEFLYPGVSTIWSEDYFVFHDSDEYELLERRLSGDDAQMGGLPILVAANEMSSIYQTVYREQQLGLYNEFRQAFMAAYPNIDIDVIRQLVLQEQRQFPLYATHSISVTIASAILTEHGPQIVIEFLFSPGGDQNVKSVDASRGRYTWDELFN